MYIDAHQAAGRGIIQKIKVRLNGRRMSGVVAAKAGPDGFVEWFDKPARIVYKKPNGDRVKSRPGRAAPSHIFLNKARGLVKISFNLWPGNE